MSAMLDNYDTQMVEYSADIDVQMQPSLSDIWLQDEAKMEEDVPGTKLGVYTLASDSQLTIEVDMDEHQDAEYDMVDDDDDAHGFTSGIFDVDVYDASEHQSPGMGAFDTLPSASAISPFQAVQPLPSPVSYIEPPITEPEKLEFQHASQSVQSENDVPSETHSSQDVQNAGDSDSIKVPGAAGDNQEDALDVLDSLAAAQPSTKDKTLPDDPLPETLLSEKNDELEPVPQIEPIEEFDEGDSLPLPAKEHVQDDHPETLHIHDSVPQGDAGSSGDPHEISEGVYIDPPPPVLLSLSLQGLHFDHAFFNQPPSWNDTTEKDPTDNGHILLHNLPTLYYEPLSSLFEALRQEEVIHSCLDLRNELVLEAIDLALAITEDNVYAREVALHDLNILHDVSGETGLLRMRLYASTPRFIFRYHQLQERSAVVQSDSSVFARDRSAVVNEDASLDPPNNAKLELTSPPPHTTEEQNEGDTDLHSFSNVESGAGSGDGPSNERDSVPYTHESSEDLHANTEDIDDQPHVNCSDAVEEERQVEISEQGTSGNDIDSAASGGSLLGLDLLEQQEGDGPLFEQDYEANFGDENEENLDSDLVEEEIEGDPGGDQKIEQSHDGVADEEEEYVEEYVVDGVEGAQRDGDDTEDDETTATGGVSLRVENVIADAEVNREIEESAAEGAERTQQQDDISNDIGDAVPDLPTEPIGFDDENTEEWSADDHLAIPGNGESEYDEDKTDSATISSRASKRSFDELEDIDKADVEYRWTPPSPPDAKRSRTE